MSMLFAPQGMMIFNPNNDNIDAYRQLIDAYPNNVETSRFDRVSERIHKVGTLHGRIDSWHNLMRNTENEDQSGEFTTIYYTFLVIRELVNNVWTDGYGNSLNIVHDDLVRVTSGRLEGTTYKVLSLNEYGSKLDVNLEQVQ